MTLSCISMNFRLAQWLAVSVLFLTNSVCYAYKLSNMREHYGKYVISTGSQENAKTNL
ncbi:exported hypothetical protein [Xenorhabdus cabanillasii JM26]|uniref:Uncharacterized protein n=1 Tax=Xenorhabdus cabanillasii JM26 TaxID=1427517 RepID=W1J7T0_9GAMM|nr:exported hypothetical protein [Xenorhabdus cabanillasii JM26]